MVVFRKKREMEDLNRELMCTMAKKEEAVHQANVSRSRALLDFDEGNWCGLMTFTVRVHEYHSVDSCSGLVSSLDLL